MKWTYAVSGCCVLLLGLNIALVYQNRELKSRLSVPPPVLQATAGTRMPDLKGFDPDGNPVAVRYGSDPRQVLVLVFSPTCPFCEQNWPRWAEVIKSLDRSRVRPVGVDLTSTTTDSFASEHAMGEMPVIAKVDPLARVDYRFQLTPQTILLDGSGKVEKVWTGVLNSAAVAELKQRLSGSKAASVSGAHTGF
ncbi:MAG: peroxiredoxin family protein [Actinomycetota bacterium]